MPRPDPPPCARSGHTGRAHIRPHVWPATAELRLQSCRSRAPSSADHRTVPHEAPGRDTPGVVTGDTGGPRPAWTPLPVVRSPLPSRPLPVWSEVTLGALSCIDPPSPWSDGPSPAVPSGTLTAFLGPSLRIQGQAAAGPCPPGAQPLQGGKVGDPTTWLSGAPTPRRPHSASDTQEGRGPCHCAVTGGEGRAQRGPLTTLDTQ